MNPKHLFSLFVCFWLVLNSTACARCEDLPIILEEFSFDRFYTKQVVDKETLQPMAYVNVGIVDNFHGTVSNESGFFRLELTDEFNAYTLRFSYIGYETLDIPVAKFRAMTDETIALKRKESRIEMLERPTQFRTRTIGNRTPRLKAVTNINRDNGSERGILLPIRRRTFLKEFNMPIIYRNSDTDSLVFRLNFYRQVGRTDFETILNEPIYVRQRLDNGSQNVTVDLTPYNIVVNENTLVTVESIRIQEAGYVDMIGGFFRGRRSFGRAQSQSDLGKMPFWLRLSMTVTAEVER